MAYTQNYMHKPDEKGFPNALRALMVLQDEAAKTTPQGGQTVSDKLMQGIAQPSGGTPAPAPNPADGAPAPTMQDMVNNAGIAGGVEAQQQAAQQQQMAQMAAQAGGQPGQPPDQQMAQAGGQPGPALPTAQPPQMMAEGGIASLPVEMHGFAEGGILGFDGTEEQGSEVPLPVPAPEEEATSTAGDFFRGIGARLAEAQRKKEIEGKMRSGLKRTTPGLFESLTPSDRASRVSQASQMEAFYRALTGDTGGDASKSTAAPEVKFDYQEGSDPAVLANQLHIAMERESDPAKKSQIKAEIDRLIKSIPPRAPTGTPPGNEGFGINLGSGSDSKRPTADDALALAEKFAGAQPDRSKIEALEAQRRQVAEEEPAIDTEAMRKAYEKEKEGREFERFIALNEGERRGLGGSGPAYIQFQKSIAERDAAYNSFEQNAKHAMWERRRGNTKDALAYEEQANKDMLEYNKLRGQVGANLYGTNASIYNSELDREGQREAALSRIMAAQLRKGSGATPQPTFAELKILDGMVAQHFASPAAIVKSPEATELISKMPGGKKLLVDLQEENITPEEFMAAPSVAQARNLFRTGLLGGSKYGHPAVPDIDTALANEPPIDETD